MLSKHPLAQWTNAYKGPSSTTPHCRTCSGRAMLCAFVMNGRATCDPYTWMWNAVEGGLKPPNGDQADTRSVKSQVTLAKCARNTCDKGGHILFALDAMLRDAKARKTYA